MLFHCAHSIPPLQLLREELKSYARKHNLAEYEETIRTLLQSYGISETLEQLQVSKISSQVPQEATTPSDKGVCNTSTAGTRKLKPKSLNNDTQVSTKISPKKVTAQRTTAAAKTRASVVGKPVNASKGSVGNGSIKKKAQNPDKHGSDNGEEKVQDQDEKSVAVEGKTDTQAIKETLDGNKENMDAPLNAEMATTEVN